MKTIEFFIPRKLSLTALGIQSQSAVSRKARRLRMSVRVTERAKRQLIEAIQRLLGKAFMPDQLAANTSMQGEVLHFSHPV